MVAIIHVIVTVAAPFAHISTTPCKAHGKVVFARAASKVRAIRARSGVVVRGCREAATLTVRCGAAKAETCSQATVAAHVTGVTTVHAPPTRSRQCSVVTEVKVVCQRVLRVSTGEKGQLVSIAMSEG